MKKSIAERLVAENPDALITNLVDLAIEELKPHKSNIPRFRRQAEKKFIAAMSKGKEEPNKEPKEPVVGGTVESPEKFRQQATGKTFIFSCVQNNTILFDAWWNSLMQVVQDKDAELYLGTVVYNKAVYGKNSVKPGTKKASDSEDLFFDPRAEQYIVDQDVQIAPDLIWLGELNLSPTRVDPINGYENHGRGASVIIPHVKMAMRSVPTMKHKPARFAYSTGTVTARNYIQKAAGQKASLHHVYGALLVEVDDEGNWWARQLNSDENGIVYDLDKRYDGEKIEKSVVASIVHGDLHGNKVSEDNLKIMSRVVDTLKPQRQFFHDIVDFEPRNHHNINDPHFLAEMHALGRASVDNEFEYIASMVDEYLSRKYCRNYVVTSNHDQAIETWLKNTAGFYDPENVRLWLELNSYILEERSAGRKARPFWHLIKDYLPDGNWNIVHEDDSVEVAGVEHGMHGHLGPNGARGAPKNLRTVGKANTGHTHSASIYDGVYTAGVMGNLDMGYNKGPSSWSPSFIVTYENGKRTICTIRNGKAWR